MIKFVGITLGVLIMLFTGCSKQDEVLVAEDESADTTNNTTDWQINIVNNQLIVKANGKIIAQTWEQYQTEIYERISPDGFKSLTMLVSEETSGDESAPQWQVGKYYIHIAWDRHPLGACINRVASHLNVTVYDTSGFGKSLLIFNAHFAFWRESAWQVCAALWESRSNFCVRLCNPTWQQLQNAWYDAFLAVGVSAVIAWWLANLLTPISVSVLAI